MLVLSRREGEWIRIGDAITITIVRMGGDKVRVGIDAPADQLILRGELEVRDRSQQQMATINTADQIKPAA